MRRTRDDITQEVEKVGEVVAKKKKKGLRFWRRIEVLM